MSKAQIVDLFILRTGANKRTALRYLKLSDDVLQTALTLYRADKNEGKLKI
ncbi:hypothetical protein ACQYRI_08690 [Salmonella enterica]